MSTWMNSSSLTIEPGLGLWKEKREARAEAARAARTKMDFIVEEDLREMLRAMRMLRTLPPTC